MECLQLRSPPGPFHYLISEQAKSLVALQELQNEVGALLEFRDLVIETFPNLRSKMAPSTPASGTRRDWEPGVRVRRKLAGGTGDTARAKPQPSVQDSGFSTETSCGKDAHSSASASASASRSRPLEDELWTLLDIIQRKGVKLREEVELLRNEIDERHSTNTAEESFAQALSNGCGDCTDLVQLRNERDALLVYAAQLEAAATIDRPAVSTPLGRLDSVLNTPARTPRVPTPDSKKFAAVLLESNPVELQRQLLISIVQHQDICEQLKRAAAQRSVLLEKLERARDQNEDLKFRLEEKSIELEGAKARVRQLENRQRSENDGPHSSMRDMRPLRLPDDDEPRITETPRPSIAETRTSMAETPRPKPSRIPLHTAHKGAAPRPPSRPASAHSSRSASRSASRPARSAVPVRSSPAPAPDKNGEYVEQGSGPARGSAFGRAVSIEGASLADDLSADRSADSRLDTLADRKVQLVAEYLARTERLAPLFPRLQPRTRPLPLDLIQECRLAYETPQNLALELTKSILYENVDSIDVNTLKSLNSQGDESLWNGKPQQYFESMKYGEDVDDKEFEDDSLA